MTWITPKTNWTQNDYFTLSDAERIRDNVRHLKSMAEEIYPDAEIMGFFPRYLDRSTGIQYYTKLNLSLSELYDDPPFTLGERALLYNFSFIIANLTILKILSTQSSVNVVTDIALDYDIPSGPAQVLYTGYGMILDSDSFIGYLGLIDYYEYIRDINYGYYWMDKIRSPYSYIPGRSGDGSSAISLTYWQPTNFFPSFANTPFYYYFELNNIEQHILTIYNTFSSYLGG